ncbi:hypothetical protein [Parafrankia sp. EUN1f]|uniref:hypothetical protein n=1 Tax=Parafrankia sp. EUN1f TaxID=102897 RepID=UPI0001C43908|nr:hypothetical protein [Parafrankia sp. EUN1f]EFC86236.1 hypothetical protein FrEUN1fDRAFT_0673 [Parafrankia sp. EUN1f]
MRAPGRQAEDSATELGDIGTLIYVWYIRGRRALHKGDPAMACSLFDRLDETTERLGMREPCLVPWGRDAIMAYVRVGRRDSAARLVSRLEAVGGPLPCAWPRIAAACGRALLAGDQRRGGGVHHRPHAA